MSQLEPVKTNFAVAHEQASGEVAILAKLDDDHQSSDRLEPPWKSICEHVTVFEHDLGQVSQQVSGA